MATTIEGQAGTARPDKAARDMTARELAIERASRPIWRLTCKRRSRLPEAGFIANDHEDFCLLRALQCAAQCSDSPMDLSITINGKNYRLGIHVVPAVLDIAAETARGNEIGRDGLISLFLAMQSQTVDASFGLKVAVNLAVNQLLEAHAAGDWTP